MLPLDITGRPCDSPTMSKPAQHHELDVDRPDWHADAACRDQPLELWFPDWSLFGGKPRPSTPTDAWSYSPHAAAVCLTCPAQDPCLDYALHRNVDGIWGGTTPPERRRLRRQRGIALVEEAELTAPIGGIPDAGAA